MKQLGKKIIRWVTFLAISIGACFFPTRLFAETCCVCDLTKADRDRCYGRDFESCEDQRDVRATEPCRWMRDDIGCVPQEEAEYFEQCSRQAENAKCRDTLYIPIDIKDIRDSQESCGGERPYLITPRAK